ncbi:MAG: pilus assembly protein [Candidatus Adiutrix sp.]|jgi:hypothetical protein|nr:pilus assembly protein [Candidatus Adiutrix sp.]
MKGPQYGTRGSVSVEFALTATAFVVILAMSLEVARVQVASMLLERSVYDIAYQIKVARGQDSDVIVESVLAARNNGLFSVDEVTVALSSAPTMEGALAGGAAGAGGGSDIVRLDLSANLNLLGRLVPEPLRINRTIVYYFQNEPDLEDVR